jgi:hypothetical protein
MLNLLRSEHVVDWFSPIGAEVPERRLFASDLTTVAKLIAQS